MNNSSEIVYPISTAYCPGWSVPDAIRELVANAFDHGAKFTHEWVNGELVISDKGNGIPRSALVLGNSTSRDSDEKIGQFGEGLDVAALVCAREDRLFEVDTVGYQATASIRYDQSLESKILVLSVESNERTSGTRIRVACSQSEANEALERFLVVKHGSKVKPAQSQILAEEDPGRIYVLGVLVQEDQNSILSYNLTSKEMQNRDRTVVDENSRDGEISKLLGSCRDANIIEKLLRESIVRPSSIESRCYPEVDHNAKPAWRKAARQLAEGKKKICVSDQWTAEQLEEQARYLGWHVLSLPAGLCRALKTSGIPLVGEAVMEAQKPVWMKLKDLSTQDRRHFNRARLIARRLYPHLDHVKVRVYSEIKHEEEGEQTVGLWIGDKNLVGIRVCQLNSLDAASSVMLHEFAHAASGSGDCSARFESELTSLLGRLANGEHKKPRRRKTSSSAF